MTKQTSAKNKSFSSTSNEEISEIKNYEFFNNPSWNDEKARRNINDNLQARHSSQDSKMVIEVLDSLKAQMKICTKKHIIPESAGKKLSEALDKITVELNSQNIVNSNRSVYDVIESKIREKAPEVYGWFWVARSKSSQKAGDLRFWLRSSLDKLDREIRDLQESLIESAETSVKAIFPMMSHMQITQPSSFGHHLLAYVEAFARDRSRMADARKRLNESPYMSGEGAGTSYQSALESVAKQLDFAKHCSNSVDAVSSRDYAIESLSAFMNCGLTLSKFANEMIYWHSSGCNYISLPQDLVDQSDAVPFKRDLKPLESARAQAQTIIGNLQAAAMVYASVPMQYSSELDEINTQLITAVENLSSSLSIVRQYAESFTINRKRMKEAASKNFSTAIDLVDWIVQNAKVDLLEAQSLTRKVIDFAISKGKKLSLLELSEIKKIIPQADDTIFSVLIPSRAITSRRSGNGSNPVQVRKSIRAAKRTYLQ